MLAGPRRRRATIHLERLGVKAASVRPGWPFDVPAVRHVVDHGLELTTPVTFLVGENGSGKSTLLEAIAVAFGLDVRGGHGGRRYASTAPSEGPLAAALSLWPPPPGGASSRKRRQGFFLRAETAHGVLGFMSDMGVTGYGDRHLGEVSHGESYLQVLQHQFARPALFLLDEPEGPLSFTSTLQLMAILHEVGRIGGQVVCATHSPVLTALPDATLLECSDHGIEQVAWENLDVVHHTRTFLELPDAYLRHLVD